MQSYIMSDPIVEVKKKLNALYDERLKIEKEIQTSVDRLQAPGQPGLKESLLDAEGFPRADLDLPRIRADRHLIICRSNDYKDITNEISSLLEKLHELQTKSRSVANNPDKVPTVPIVMQTNESTVEGKKIEPKDYGEKAKLKEDSTIGPSSTTFKVNNVPFAIVDEVSEGSPGYEAGLQLGDQICQAGRVSPSPASLSLGSAATESGALLQAMAAVLGEAARENAQPPGSSSESSALANGQIETGVVKLALLRMGQIITLDLRPHAWQGRGVLGCHLKPVMY